MLPRFEKALKELITLLLRVHLVGEVEKWEDRKVKIGEDRRDLIFSYLCLVGRMGKWRDENFICLVERKKMR